MSNTAILASVFLMVFGMASLLQMLKALTAGGSNRASLAPLALMTAVVLATAISKFFLQLLPA